MPSPLARAVDTVRKRYKRQLASAQKVAASTKGEAREAALQRVEQAQKAIDELRYQRDKGGYSSRISANIEQIEFSSRQGQRLGRERLRMSGQEAEFYATTKQLWQGVSDRPDQAVIKGLNELSSKLDIEIFSRLEAKGLKPGKLETLNDAVSMVEELTAQDFTNPPADMDEKEQFYNDAKIRRGMLALQQLAAK